MHIKSVTAHMPTVGKHNTQLSHLPKPHTPLTTTTVISWILQGGILISSTLIVLGLCLLPLRPGGLSVHRVLTFPHTLGDIWAGLLMLQPQSIIVLGLFLLIATPVVRVAISVVAFALEHDRRYVAITLAVLGILLLSFALGRGGA